MNKRLKDWIGKYRNFKFSYANTPKESFEKECKNFHDFGGLKSLENEIHPDRAAGTKWKCLYCRNFE